MTTPMMRKTLLASSLFLLPGLANALGLGTIDVKSALNEPLNAEIELVFASPAEQESLSVRLAREEDFQRVGLDASRLTVPLQFSVDRGSKGQPVIRVTSDRPVRDPALTILLEVNWGAGRLLREYSILLDPPLMAPAIRGSAAVATAVAEPAPAAVVETTRTAPAAEPAPAPAPVSAPPPKVAPAPAATARTEPEAPKPEPKPAPKPEPKPEPVQTAAAAPPPPPAPVSAPPPAPAPAAATYGPVDPGKNLLQVAREVAPGSAEEMNRFMVAVLRTNPQSFYQDNVNALKRGAVLTLPTERQLAAINPAEAAEVVRTHNDLWRQYAQSAAAQPTRLADSGSAGATRSGGSEAAGADSRLELVPPKAGDGQGAADAPGSSTRNAGNAEEVSKLRRDLQLRQEELSSAQRELDEMRSRVKDLEGLKGKQDALIKLKDDEIAQLQARLAEISKEAEAARAAAGKAEDALRNAAAAPAAVVAETTPAPEAEPAPEPAPATVAADTQDDAAAAGGDDIWGGTEAAPTEAAPTEGDPPTAAAEGDTTVAAAPEPTPAEPVPAPAPVPPPVDTAAEPEAAPASGGGLFSLPVIGGVLALLAAGIGAFVWQRSRRGKPDRKSALPPIMPADASDGDVGFAADPEEDLRDRVAMNPSDLGAHLELLRHLHGEGKADAFDAASESMYRYVSDPDCAEWREVLMLGADLMPQHPRFATTPDASWSATPAPANDLGDLDLGSLEASGSPAPAPAPDFRFDFDSPAPAGPPTLDLGLPAPAPAPAPATAPNDFEFNFDNLLAPAPAPASAVKPAAPEAPSFDFDLGAPTASPAPAPAAAPAVDFGFDLDSEGPTRRVEPVPAPPAPAPASDFSFDFDSLLSPAPAPAAPAPARPAPVEAPSDAMALPDLDSLMDSLAPAAAPTPAPAPAASDLALDLGDLDLNFGDLKAPTADFKPIELETRMPPQQASALDQPDVIPLDTEFNLDDPSFLGGDDAIATKLDLARAYIDMSDPDGARAMLEEVLLEGSDAQKSEAREILARIG